MGDEIVKKNWNFKLARLFSFKALAVRIEIVLHAAKLPYGRVMNHQGRGSRYKKPGITIPDLPPKKYVILYHLMEDEVKNHERQVRGKHSVFRC